MNNNNSIETLKPLSKNENFSDFKVGLKLGIPIALGYVPVSFTFGLIAVNGDIPIWTTIFISLTNLTSAGQFVGTNLIINGAAFLEIALTTFIINIRYMLMSLSLSQKVVENMSLLKRCIIAFGITDETFSIASMEKKDISFSYMIGLITCPYWGWALGTALGAITCSVLPEALKNSMGIALYAMFIAIVVPVAKRSRPALVVTFTGIMFSCVFKWAPMLNAISQGWAIIISTVLACSIGAFLFPKEDV